MQPNTLFERLSAISNVLRKSDWVLTTIDVDSELLLDVGVYSRFGTDPVAAFPNRLAEKHDATDTGFLTDSGGDLALFQYELSRQLNYTERNHIGKWFWTVTMWIDHFRRSGGAINQAQNEGSDGSDTITTVIDRIKH